MIFILCLGVNTALHMDTTQDPNKPAIGGGQTDARGNETNSGRASFATGSTTQGGSNHGQGSHDTGGSPYRQGAEGAAASSADPLNGPGPVGDAVDTGTSFTGAVDATGQDAAVVGDSYGRNDLPGNAVEAAGADGGGAAAPAPETTNLAAQDTLPGGRSEQFDTDATDGPSVDQGAAGQGEESSATSA